MIAMAATGTHLQDQDERFIYSQMAHLVLVIVSRVINK